MESIDPGCLGVESWDDSLRSALGNLFEEFVIPANIIPVLQSENILGPKEIQSVEAETKNKGPSAGARLLFSCLRLKSYYVLPRLLRDKNVKLGHIADRMQEEIKKDKMNRMKILSERQPFGYVRPKFVDHYGLTFIKTLRDIYVNTATASRIPCTLTSRKSNRKKCSAYSDSEPTRLSDLYIKYNRNLGSKIRPLFLDRIGDPVNALHVLQTYSDKVLTKIDCENVKAETTNKGNHAGADLLFSRLVLYESWLDVLLKALRDDEIGLPDLAEKIELLTHFDEMADDSRDIRLREVDSCDIYESNSAELRPSARIQTRSTSTKENSF